MKYVQNKVTPFLGFNTQAEEAATFYASLLPGSEVVKVVRNPFNGQAMLAEFTIGELTFMALNMGVDMPPTHAFSISIACDSQAEIDELWDKLKADGGKEVQCGWVQDRFGISWQVVPRPIGHWISGGDAKKSAAVMSVMMQMVKLDYDKLEAAFNES